MDNFSGSGGGYPQIFSGVLCAVFGLLSLRAMNFTTFLSAGVGVLADFSRDAALAAGLSTTRIRDLARVHDVFYGPTQFTRKQADALLLADGMPLDQLVHLEKKLAAVPSAAQRWRIRLELLRHRGSFRALSKRIAKLIDDPAPPPKPACRFSRSRGGMRTMTVTYNERDLADLEHMLRAAISDDEPAAAQLADALFRVLRDGSALPRTTFRPMILVPVHDYLRIMGGAGDDVQLMLTDGTTMTGAEFLQQEFGDVLEVAAFHPQDGAVNLYRAERLANTKQRTLSKLMSPGCAFPDCRHSAETTQTHHMQAWKHGGMTNMDNLTELCTYHNGVNDDDRWLGWRGHIDTRGGRIRWIAPNGAEVATVTGAMEVLFG